MWFRANAVLAVAVLLAIVFMFATVTGGPRIGVRTLGSGNGPGFGGNVSAQEDNEDNEDDEDNTDDDDDDNADAEDDNTEDDDNADEDNTEDDNNDGIDNSNSNDDADNSGDEDLDNVDTAPAEPAAAPAPPPGLPSEPALPPPSGFTPGDVQITTDNQGVTQGADGSLTLQGGRIVVRVYPSMPFGVTLKLRLVDPLSYAATPGVRAGDLIFILEAVDQQGATLSQLPAEVNLSVRYSDADVTGLNEPAITMARLDPNTNQWTSAPKMLAQPDSNYIAASVMQPGVYAVYAP